MTIGPEVEREGTPSALPKYPESPVLATVWRGDWIESVHRGAWCLVDSSGSVVESAGPIESPFFSRSSIKCLQALPLIETGAADRYGFGDPEIALAVSSHDAQPCHVETAEGMLGRVGLDAGALRCGPQAPSSIESRNELQRAGADPTAIHNNCSGKHSGFLALGAHLGADPATYLEYDGDVQRIVRDAVLDVTGADRGSLTSAIDGCSAPTYRLTLRELAMAFARVTTPDGLAPERRAAATRIVEAVRRHPTLLAGDKRRLCTALVRASEGALFPKIGAEAVYVVGVPGRDLALAVKMDDGGRRGLHAVVIEVLRRRDLLTRDAYDALTSYRQPVLRNWAGLEVGRIDVES